MNPSSPSPPRDPKRFIKSVFDLAYGRQDGSEPLTDAEVKEGLIEAGIDPDAAWKSFQELVARTPPASPPPPTAAAPKSLEAVRQRRLANLPPPLATTAAASAEAIIADIKQLLAALGPAGAAAVFGRKWENSSPEDLAALHEQLKRQVERSREP